MQFVVIAPMRHDDPYVYSVVPGRVGYHELKRQQYRFEITVLGINSLPSYGLVQLIATVQ
jgi:hypothetical protein